jgi:hypothetical protein
VRKILIMEESTGSRKWFAIDQTTRKSLLRHFHIDHLRNICHRRWQVVEAESYRSRPSGFKRRA